MTDLTTLCNRDLMSYKRRLIDEMNRFRGWKDRTELDRITNEIKERIETGRML